MRCSELSSDDKEALEQALTWVYKRGETFQGYPLNTPPGPAGKDTLMQFEDRKFEEGSTQYHTKVRALPARHLRTSSMSPPSSSAAWFGRVGRVFPLCGFTVVTWNHWRRILPCRCLLLASLVRVCTGSWVLPGCVASTDHDCRAFAHVFWRLRRALTGHARGVDTGFPDYQCSLTNEQRLVVDLAELRSHESQARSTCVETISRRVGYGPSQRGNIDRYPPPSIDGLDRSGVWAFTMDAGVCRPNCTSV